MTDSRPDPERTPVVIASGQSIERDGWVTPVDLMVRAAEQAFGDAPGLRGAIDLISVVNIMTRTGPAPATELAGALGIVGARCEATTIGGNTPQWLVNRAATAIAAGELGATLIAGAEGLRSYRGLRAAGLPRAELVTGVPPDPVVGDDLPGVGPAEGAIGLVLPVHVYAMFESVVARRAGHDAATHRRAMGALFAPVTEVAAANPYAWFPEARSADAIASPSPDNRIVSEPYTKRMTAFLGSDQGAAVVVCSLAVAQRAGVADRAVFVWAGAEAVDVRAPVARTDPGRSPAIAAAGRALWTAGSEAAGAAGRPGGAVGIDDIEVLDLYSCFPSAVELAAEALGLRTDDTRGLTSTGGLPYFGGPGNNYTTHGIAAVTDRLRRAAGSDPGAAPRLGLATGLGWFVTKHALGLYGTTPPPGGFRRGDTATDQAVIDAGAAEVALEVDEATVATVVAATVARDGDGSPTAAPVFARLPDGRQMALAPADDEVLVAVAGLDVPGLVGTQIVVQPGPARYRLPTR
jgi:acetyl-CoA C-acetyltransferase